MFEDRIRLASLRDRVMSADDAAKLIGDGMVVGMSGFTRAGDAKDMPIALAKRAKAHPMKITLITGASLGHDSDKTLTQGGADRLNGLLRAAAFEGRQVTSELGHLHREFSAIVAGEPSRLA